MTIRGKSLQGGPVRLSGHPERVRRLAVRLQKFLYASGVELNAYEADLYACDAELNAYQAELNAINRENDVSAIPRLGNSSFTRASQSAAVS